MDPLTWLHLLSWSVKVMVLSDFPASISVDTEWRLSGEVPFVWSEPAEALEIRFKMAGNSLVSNRYLVLPSCDLSFIRNNEEAQFSHPECIGVTPFCIVYRMPVDFIPNSSTERDLQKRIGQVFSTHLNIQSYEPTHIDNGITLPGQVQVIRMEEFPHSVNLQIALPGTISVDSLRLGFPGKMIHVTLIPDMGEPLQRWIKGIDEQILCTGSLSSNLFSQLEKLLREASSQNFFPEVEMYYLKAVEEMNGFLDDQQGDDTCRSFLNGLIHRLFCQSRQVQFAPEWDIFPDYQPKVSPDQILDFRPVIEDRLMQLPSPNQANIKLLVKIFRRYQRLARRNPGNWEDGNMVLGARAKEYNPSDEELMLSEVGRMIRDTAESLTPEQLSKAVRGVRWWSRMLKFNEFTFTHSDVMGSGRFFYVDEIKPIHYKLSR